MADHRDEIMESLAHQISLVYTMLVDVCRMLPVPIELPADKHTPGRQAVPAIQRVVELGRDQPMGDLQEGQLYSGCIHLLAAIDLYALCSMRYHETRAEACGANLLCAEDPLKTLMVWLLIHNSTE